jgi:fructoselysine-6-P-deglycase FrlB-like protein
MKILNHAGQETAALTPQTTKRAALEGALGKPFDTEMEALPSTYAWAISQPVDQLARSIERLQACPLLAVGSGGSFSVCHFATHLHGLIAGQTAIPLTPLQAVAERTPTSGMGVIIPTAGGNNPDVVAAVRMLAEQEPQHILVLCGNSESRVASLSARYEMIDFVSYDLPTGKDGFLATNSLLAFCILLSRAYSQAAGQCSDLPKDYRSLLSDKRLGSRPATRHDQFREILERQTLLVLHGPTTLSAAIDIESKFTEAALGHIQICDFRQFAHGRHHWLAKRPADTAILSLETSVDAIIASQTLGLLPASLPIKRIVTEQRGSTADLGAICEGFYLVDAAGHFQGIDPGRPGVPSFGRKLYHANAFPVRKTSNDIPQWKCRAIERKAFQSVERLVSEDQLPFWLAALDSTLDELASARFAGVVVDYDGTLCGEDHRFDPLPSEMACALTDLMEAGLFLGVATGRGKSVRERLREAFAKKYWPQITVGYYNGGHVIPLHSTEAPDGTDHVGGELLAVAKALQADGLLTHGKITLRDRQITLGNVPSLSIQALCAYGEAIANRISPNGIRVMRSGHSVDIVPEAVSKLAVVNAVRDARGIDGAAVLRIGDRGMWPGNDSQLLSSPHGLSVYEVSPDPQTCWNIAPSGHRGSQATLGYLKQLKVTKKGIRLQLPKGARP